MISDFWTRRNDVTCLGIIKIWKIIPIMFYELSCSFFSVVWIIMISCCPRHLVYLTSPEKGNGEEQKLGNGASRKERRPSPEDGVPGTHRGLPDTGKGIPVWIVSSFKIFMLVFVVPFQVNSWNLCLILSNEGTYFLWLENLIYL